MLRASTGISAQADVWATSLAINLGVLTGQSRLKAAQYLRDAYVKGELSQKGNIRHVVQSDDFSATSAWEKSVVPINTYQNGAYWGTPVGWVCHAIAYVDLPSAQKLAKEFIQELLDPKTQNEAFQKLLHTYQRPLYHHIRNIVLNHDDTDDVLQNTFIKVFQNLKNFKGESKLFSWMYRIATNESLTFIKQKAKKNNT